MKNGSDFHANVLSEPSEDWYRNVIRSDAVICVRVPVYNSGWFRSLLPTGQREDSHVQGVYFHPS